MQQVITADQVRQITGGRTPHMPIEYEAAVKSLQACLTLDEAKYWSDKADALQAWAKIYRDPDAERKAKQVRLHAYRRMGQLAAELRPTRYSKGHKGRENGGPLPGPKSLLIEQGLTKKQADAARRAALTPTSQFESFIDRERVPAPSSLFKASRTRDLTWGTIHHRMQALRASFRQHSGRDVAQLVGGDDVQMAIGLVTELSDWLDEFEQHLPKGDK